MFISNFSRPRSSLGNKTLLTYLLTYYGINLQKYWRTLENSQPIYTYVAYVSFCIAVVP